MTRLHSTPSRTSSKPRKPRPDFPLFKHGSGQWAKKVRQRLAYFGSWTADPSGQKALALWLDQKDQLLAGRKPRKADPNALTVKRLIDLFLESRERRVKTGELAQCTLADYLSIGEQVADQLGRATPVEHLLPQDFAELRDWLAEGVNLKTLEGRIACVRAIFNHAEKNGWLSCPLSRLWGTEFRKPSTTALRKLKSQTVRMFAAAEIGQLMDHAGPQVKAMMLLGINCGFGPTDCAMLRESDVDPAGIVTLARSKTGQVRRCPLWPETLAAIRTAIEHRPEPVKPDDAGLVFLTARGNSWLPTTKPAKKTPAKKTERWTTNSPLSSEFRKLAVLAGISGKGKSFYTLRHCFQTIGDETRDFPAVSSIMGHAVATISDNYRERIDDTRLRVVTDHVRKWLLAAMPKPKRTRKVSKVEGGSR